VTTTTLTVIFGKLPYSASQLNLVWMSHDHIWLVAGMIAINCMTIVHKLLHHDNLHLPPRPPSYSYPFHSLVKRLTASTYKIGCGTFVYINRKEVKIVCIELSVNMQDTPTTDSRGVLASLSNRARIAVVIGPISSGGDDSRCCGVL